MTDTFTAAIAAFLALVTTSVSTCRLAAVPLTEILLVSVAGVAATVVVGATTGNTEATATGARDTASSATGAAVAGMTGAVSAVVTGGAGAIVVLGGTTVGAGGEKTGVGSWLVSVVSLGAAIVVMVSLGKFWCGAAEAEPRSATARLTPAMEAIRPAFIRQYSRKSFVVTAFGVYVYMPVTNPPQACVWSISAALALAIRPRHAASCYATLVP